MRLCDWCDEPTSSDVDELCPRCARAKEVESNARTFIEPVKEEKPGSALVRGIFNDLIIVGQFGFGTVLVLGLGAIVAALLGTCALMATFGTLGSSIPIMGLGFLVLTILTFGAAALLFKGAYEMFQTPPKEIQRPKRSLPAIESAEEKQAGSIEEVRSESTEPSDEGSPPST
jgi:hypothetical protein